MCSGAKQSVSRLPFNRFCFVPGRRGGLDYSCTARGVAFSQARIYTYITMELIELISNISEYQNLKISKSDFFCLSVN